MTSINSPKEAWAYEADVEQRDVNNLNDHLKVGWENVFAEPSGIHSARCCWRYSAKCFEMWKNLCYVIVTALCGIWIAMCWGCYFAFTAFEHIWCIGPNMRALMIECAVFKKCYTMLMESLCDPCCISIGKVFSAFGKGN